MNESVTSTSPASGSQGFGLLSSIEPAIEDKGGGLMDAVESAVDVKGKGGILETLEGAAEEAVKGNNGCGLLAKISSVFKGKGGSGVLETIESVGEEEKGGSGILGSIENAVESKLGGGGLLSSVESTVEGKGGGGLLSSLKSILVGKGGGGLLSSMESTLEGKGGGGLLSPMESTLEGKGGGGLLSSMESTLKNKKGGSQISTLGSTVDGKERTISDAMKGGEPDLEAIAGNVMHAIGESRIRFVVLFILCFMGLTYNLMWESPGALQNSLMKEYNMTSFHFSILYSVQSWANIFCWISRFLIDRYMGVKLGSIFFLIICSCGTIVYSLGSIIGIFWILIVGRAFFGFGGQTQRVTVRYYLHHWFGVKEYGVALSITKAFPILGGAIVFIASNILRQFLTNFFQDTVAIGATITFTMMAIYLTLVCSVLVAIFSKSKVEKSDEATSKHDSLVKFSDIAKFPPQYWAVSTAASTFFISCTNFIPTSQKFIIQKYSMTVNEADAVTSSFFIGTCLLWPVVGWSAARKGRYLSFISLASLGGAIAHFTFNFTIVNPFLPMVVLSLCNAMMLGSVWSAYKQTVQGNQLANAHLTAETMMNIVHAVGALSTGTIIDKYDYEGAEIFYLSSLGCSLASCVAAWIADSRTGGNLNARNTPQLSTSQQNLVNNEENDKASESSPKGTTQPPIPSQSEEKKLSPVVMTEIELPKVTARPLTRSISDAARSSRIPTPTASRSSSKESVASQHSLVKEELTKQRMQSPSSSPTSSPPSPRGSQAVSPLPLRRDVKVRRPTPKLVIPPPVITRRKRSPMQGSPNSSLESTPTSQPISPKITEASKEASPSTSSMQLPISPSPTSPIRRRITPEPRKPRISLAALDDPPRIRPPSTERKTSEPVYFYHCSLPSCRICTQREKEIRKISDTVIPIP